VSFDLLPYRGDFAAVVVSSVEVTYFSAAGLERKMGGMSAVSINDLAITVVFDNNEYDENLQTYWGFSCVVSGPDETILFDTGGDGGMLLDNMERLGIDPAGIGAVVLSHAHGDHVGGLQDFLKQNHDVSVYLLRSFPAGLKGAVEDAGATPVVVGRPIKICGQVFTGGELGAGIREQSLGIATDRGLVIVTGCAHPGVVEIVEEMKNRSGMAVMLVMGGFHLGGMNAGEIEEIIDSLKAMGVEHAGPCHCTGELAMAMFKDEYGKNYINVGAGRKITTDDF